MQQQFDRAGDGENLNTAITKIEANFTELFARSDTSVDASNPEYGATPTIRLEGAINNPKGLSVFLPPGEWLLALDTILETVESVNIVGVPGKTRIKYDNTDSALIIRAPYSEEYTVTALDIAVVGSLAGMDDTVTRLSIAGDLSLFEAGTTCKIYSEDPSVYGVTADDKNRIGELFKVLAVDELGGYVYVFGSLYEHAKYLTGVKVRRLSPRSVSLSGVTIVINGTKEELYDPTLTVRRSAIQFWGITDLRISQVRIESAWGQGINLIGCWNPQVEVTTDLLINGSDSNWTTIAALGYGVTTMSCYGGHIKVNGEGCRHLFTTLHPKSATYAPSRWLEYGETIGTVISGVSINSVGSPFDTHESGIGLTFSSCKAITPSRGPTGNIRGKGFSNRARHTRYTDCEAIGGNQGFLHTDVAHGETNTVTLTNPLVLKLTGTSGFAYSVAGDGSGNTVMRLINPAAEQCGRLLEVEGAKAQIQGGTFAVKRDFPFRVRDAGDLTIQGMLLDFTDSVVSEYAVRLMGSSKVTVLNTHVAGDENCTSLFRVDDEVGVKVARYSGVTSDSATLDPLAITGTNPPLPVKIDPV